MSSKQQRQLATLLILLVLVEIILHFCWKILDAYIFENFTVTAQIAIVAVIILLTLLFFREELVLLSLGGGKVGKGFYGGVYSKGQIRLLEITCFAVYVIAGLATFGLASVNLTWITDFAWFLTFISAIGIYLADKELKKSKKTTVVEILALLIAIVLPLAAAGYLTGLGIDISQYIADPTQAFVLYAISIGSMIVVAKQD